MSLPEPVKDKQLISADGKLLRNTIEGVVIHRTPSIEDERGEIVEVYRSSWGISADPLVYSYFVTIRPRAIKGWVVHRLQDDRVFTISGAQKWVLYDNREDSPTYKNLMEIFVSEKNRAVIVIPKHVFHAVQNIGDVDAMFVNMPTKPYNILDPDKLRLPYNYDLIPYHFDI